MAQQTAYIDDSAYASTTGRDAAEATAGRLTRASRLLDQRVGCWARQTSGDYTGWRLDYAGLDAYQQEAVTEWVAWMVAYLYDNGDQVDVGGSSVQLGRFSLSRSVVKETGMPGKMQFADAQLVDAGMVRASPAADVGTLPVA